MKAIAQFDQFLFSMGGLPKIVIEVDPSAPIGEVLATLRDTVVCELSSLLSERVQFAFTDDEEEGS